MFFQALFLSFMSPCNQWRYSTNIPHRDNIVTAVTQTRLLHYYDIGHALKRATIAIYGKGGSDFVLFCFALFWFVFVSFFLSNWCKLQWCQVVDGKTGEKTMKITRENRYHSHTTYLNIDFDLVLLSRWSRSWQKSDVEKAKYITAAFESLLKRYRILQCESAPSF